jgi:protein-tyrosine phosphatase
VLPLQRRLALSDALVLVRNPIHVEEVESPSLVGSRWARSIYAGNLTDLLYCGGGRLLARPLALANGLPVVLAGMTFPSASSVRSALDLEAHDATLTPNGARQSGARNHCGSTLGYGRASRFGSSAAIHSRTREREIVPPNTGPGQSIPIATVPNLRDLGGWGTPGGKVRSGLIFRSAEFANLEGEDASAFGELGIRSVYDFRTEAERAAQPNVVPDGVEYVTIDILADSTDAAPAMLLKVIDDPPAAEQALGEGRALSLFQGSYREMIDLPSARSGYKQFFEQIANPEHQPALFHCTTGKDRTGWAAASLLLLLGVSREDVFADFMLTNEQLLPMTRPVSDHFASLGGDPAVLAPVLGVQKEYLDAAIAEMTSKYGDIDAYFADGLGLDSSTIDDLRTTYTEAS